MYVFVLWIRELNRFKNIKTLYYLLFINSAQVKFDRNVLTKISIMYVKQLIGGTNSFNTFTTKQNKQATYRICPTFLSVTTRLI